MAELTRILLRHMQPTLDMLRTAIEKCPAKAWKGDQRMAVQEHAYHCLFYMDRRFHSSSEAYEPPAFHDEHAARMSGPAAQSLDPRLLLDYLDRVEAKLVDQLDVPEASLMAEKTVEGKPFSLLDACLTHLRHVQHHTAVIQRLIHEEEPVSLSWRSYLWG